MEVEDLDVGSDLVEDVSASLHVGYFNLQDKIIAEAEAEEREVALAASAKSGNIMVEARGVKLSRLASAQVLGHSELTLT